MGLHEDLVRVAADQRMRRLARRRAGSPQLAEDALQETFHNVAQTKHPETIVDLYAFFRTALIHWINQQLTRPSAVPVPDVALISDVQQGQTWPLAAARPVSVEDEAHLNLLTETLLRRLDRDHDDLMALVPARSDDPRHYQRAITESAQTIFELSMDGYVAATDWNAILKNAYAEWFDEPALTRDAIDQRLSRARRDVQALLQAIFSQDQIAS
jgi:DNA-directed RNA polymerase specialized sigma24 family protein